MTERIAQRRLRALPSRVTGAVASPSVAMISLLAWQAARYSDRRVRSGIDGSTVIDRRPLLGVPPATIPSNHLDSTNVRCCTSPARLVPDATVLGRGAAW